MRTIKFRGKRNKDGEWIYGLLSNDTKGHYRINFNPNSFSSVVKPDTVGQFTGLLDKNGKEIYEGDVIKVKMQDGDRIGRFYCKTNLPDYLNAKVKYDDSRCKFELMFEENTEGIISCEIGWGCEEFEVIGNIHDNPELLKGGKE